MSWKRGENGHIAMHTLIRSASLYQLEQGGKTQEYLILIFSIEKSGN